MVRHRFFTRALPFVLTLMSLMIWSSAEAARITKVKGKSVLIDNEGSEMVEGQKYFAVIDGKKKAVIIITKVKGDKSLGNITKGNAAVDATIQPASKSSAGGDSGGGDGDLVPKKKRRSKGGGSSEQGLYAGVLLGYAMDSQSLPDSGGNSTSMAGTGYSLKGFGDLPLSGKVGAIGRFGIEQFNLSGNSVANGAVTTSIMYLTGDVLLRYNFTEGGFVPFVAGGLGIHFPLSKSSTILNVPQISTTTVFFLDAGANFMMSPTWYLTVHGEYGYFPPSNNVTTNFITFRAGAGFKF